MTKVRLLGYNLFIEIGLTMTKLQKIQQQMLKEKASKLLGKRISQIRKEVEFPEGWNENNVGATVIMRSGAMPWINIPLNVWIGEDID